MWLFVDNNAGNKFDIELRDNLTVLDMLPISKVIVAKRSSNPEFEWILFDVYHLGLGDSELELNQLGFISSSNVNATSCGLMGNNCLNSRTFYVSGNFLSSRRRNLKGVSVICGLVVSTSWT